VFEKNSRRGWHFSEHYTEVSLINSIFYSDPDFLQE